MQELDIVYLLRPHGRFPVLERATLVFLAPDQQWAEIEFVVDPEGQGEILTVPVSDIASTPPLRSIEHRRRKTYPCARCFEIICHRLPSYVHRVCSRCRRNRCRRKDSLKYDLKFRDDINLPFNRGLSNTKERQLVGYVRARQVKR